VATAVGRVTVRWVPGALGVALLLTAVVFALAMGVAGAGPLDCVEAWGSGFWALLTFGMQMCLVLFTGGLIAGAPAVSRLLDRLASVPKTPRGAVVFMAVLSLALGYLSWGLSLVLGAVMVRRVARRVPGVDYPLLTVAAYMGVACIFHAGLSGTVPLLAATEGNFMVRDLGVPPIPVQYTLFSGLNLGLAAAAALLLPLIVFFLHPPEGRAVAASLPPEEAADAMAPARPLTPVERFERWGGLNRGIGAVGFVWVAHHIMRTGSLDLDTLNFGFLMVGLLLHPSLASVERAAADAGRSLHGIVLQFPLYAGMFGVIKGTGLAAIICDWFVSFATRETYPAIVYVYSGIMNYLVPSGGSKWAIEAPYILLAGDTLGVPRPTTLTAYAWGDMSTNIIQPFWAIPLLDIARLSFREIMPYAFVIFVVYASLPLVALLFAGGG
jgi:short-chain fatty acids transporter